MMLMAITMMSTITKAIGGPTSKHFSRSLSLSRPLFLSVFRVCFFVYSFLPTVKDTISLSGTSILFASLLIHATVKTHNTLWRLLFVSVALFSQLHNRFYEKSRRKQVKKNRSPWWTFLLMCTRQSSIQHWVAHWFYLSISCCLEF